MNGSCHGYSSVAALSLVIDANRLQRRTKFYRCNDWAIRSIFGDQIWFSRQVPS